MLLSGAAAVALALAGAAQAGEQVKYGPIPAWVKPVAPAAEVPADAGGSVQVLLFDSQSRVIPDGEVMFVRLVAKIAQPAGLQEMGSISLAWDPTTTEISFHHLHIIRDGRVIDVLAGDKFTVLRRERNLERAMLDGALTGTLQLKGLQVGDVVDYAVSQTHRDPVLAGRSQGDMRLPFAVPGKLHYSLQWPKSEKLQWRATPELGTPKLSETPDGNQLDISGENLGTLRPIEGAPDRFNPQRRLEVSEFADWAEVSALMAPLYAKAQVLAPTSPLKAEAAKIRAASDDPETRAEMALRLVQDQVRYVFIGLDSGGWVPASADETWTRRFGDCKGKTVLLLALLNELGVKAEPVLVNTAEGAAMEQRLPRLVFDHVLVRADLGEGRVYWLDGTRSGDRDLSRLTPPPFRWALPVRTAGAKLEPIELSAPLLPYLETTLRIDAREGLDKPMKVFGETRLRDDAATVTQRALTSLSKDDAERALKESWKSDFSWIEPDTVRWAYDEASGDLRLWVEGTGEDDWLNNSEDKAKRAFEVDNSGLSSIGKFKRDKAQPKDTPFEVVFPYYIQTVTIVQLPDGGQGFSLTNKDVDETVAGLSAWRNSRLQDGVVVVARAERSTKAEITAEEAEAARTRSKTYPNGTVWIEKPVGPPAVKAAKAAATPPTDANGLMLAGWGEFEEGRPEKALPLFDRALKLEPDQMWAVKGRAAVFEARGDVKRAVREFDAAIKHKPTLAEYHLWRGQTLMRAGDHAKAVEGLTAGLAVAEVKTDLRAARRTSYAAMGDYDHALVDADEAVKLAPADPDPLRARAMLYYDAKRYDAALADAEAMLALKPYAGDAWRLRGGIQLEQGRFAAATADIERALQIDPLDAGAMDGLAQVAIKSGHPEEAGSKFDSGLELAPTSVTLLNGRCWTRVMADRDLDKAVADCDAALKLAPKSPAIQDSRAWVSLRQGKLDDAIARFDAVLKVEPKLAASLYGRGLAKLRKGDAAGGQRDLAAARAVSPKVDEEFTPYGLKP